MNNKHLMPVLPQCEAEMWRGLAFESPEMIERVQTEIFLKHLKYCALNSPFYRKTFKQHSTQWQSVSSLSEIKNLPFTDKGDLDTCCSEFLSVPPEEIADVCLSSATTSSTPAQLLQTKGDLSRLAYNEEIAFETAGVEKGQTMVVGAALDRCFMAGLAYFLGAVKLGNRVIRSGASSPAQLWELIKLTRPQTVVGVPSLLRRCALEAERNGGQPRSAGVKRIIGIGESIRNSALEPLPHIVELEALCSARVLSTYASTEMATSFCECQEQKGGHIIPELIVVEIVDKDGNVLPPGRTGEIVATPLGVEGMPLLRYKTGDISFLISEKCGCGRNTMRMAPVLGRKNQMLKFKGTRVYPETFLHAVQSVEAVAGGFVEAHLNDDGTDHVILCVALHQKLTDMRIIREKVQAVARVTPEIKILTTEEFEARTTVPGKRKRILFFDLRSNAT